MLFRACLTSASKIAGNLTGSIFAAHTRNVERVTHQDSVTPRSTRFGSSWPDDGLVHSGGESRR
jgi:hypothetical protein